MGDDLLQWKLHCCKQSQHALAGLYKFLNNLLEGVIKSFCSLIALGIVRCGSVMLHTYFLQIVLPCEGIKFLTLISDQNIRVKVAGKVRLPKYCPDLFIGLSRNCIHLCKPTTMVCDG